MSDLDYLRAAIVVAQSDSTDPSTENGAVIVTREGVTISDANRFPDGVINTHKRWERLLKYSFVEHAERNVIYKAANEGHCLKGATLYCPWFACADCARAIIQSGIVRVVGLRHPEDQTNVRWKETVDIGDEMLKEANVLIERIDHYFGITILRDGREVEV